MSLVIGCDTGSLGLDDIFRLISGIDVDGNIYIRLVDGNAPAYVFDLECTNSATALDILRSALVLNADGEYALNVSSGDAAPSDIRLITVNFYVMENGYLQHHSVNAHLRVSDAH